MQRPCLLIFIRRVEFINRRQFPVAVIDQVYELVVKESYTIQSIAPMQSLLIPVMSSPAFLVQISLILSHLILRPSFPSVACDVELGLLPNVLASSKSYGR